MQKKIIEFIKRNQKRNQHLYSTDAVKGYDYVICPISGQRLSMIKSNYIIKILGMKIEDYPNVQRICNKRIENIKSGLKEIDLESGLTRYELGQIKARDILKQVDDLGQSGYARKGQKTRETHMSRVDKMGRNGYQRQAHARITTVLKNGLTVEQNSHRKQKETLIKNNKTGSGGASKQSKKALLPIINLLKENNVKFYFDSQEYGINDIETGNYYFWDLTIPDHNITIEYQSSAWHADPTLTEDEWKNWNTPKGQKRTAHEVLTYDYNKARSLYKNRGIITYYVWEKTQEDDIERILCLLKTQITKY
jgi:hypothetical protein